MFLVACSLIMDDLVESVLTGKSLYFCKAYNSFAKACLGQFYSNEVLLTTVDLFR